MAFVKLVKNNAYFKRYQTRYRRRREGKTDYYARKRLITQDKDKYNTPKYRLVVRRTCTDIIAQLTYATLRGDRIICQARAKELKKYGLQAGLTNYSSAYCVGLLISRRVLKQLNMDSTYKGKTDVDGAMYNVEDEEQDRRPFKAVLDIGIVSATTGNRCFGVLKGAIDGGLQIPHSEKRFPGFVAGEEDESDNYDAKVHRDRIFGVHVDKYMKELKSDADAYKRQFRLWDEALKKSGAKSVEDLYKKLHSDIRKDPAFKKATKKTSDKKFKLNLRLSKKERENRVAKKLAKIKKALGQK